MIERIRAIRKELCLNQVDFAQKVGLTQTYLSMIELGKTKLTEKSIKLICSTFGINEDWFRTGKGTMFASSSPHEKELLDIFAKLTPDTQDFLLEMARSLLNRQKKTQPEED